MVAFGSDLKKSKYILKNDPSIPENEIEWIDLARIEMLRIFKLLQLPQGRLKETFSKFVALRGCFHNNSKYRIPKKLIPITIYFHLNSLGISINKDQLISISSLTMKEFQAFTSQIERFRSTRTVRIAPDVIYKS